MATIPVSELAWDKFTTDEFGALLTAAFSTSSHTPGTHVVVYGNDELRVRFKNRTRTILGVERGPNLQPAKLSTLQKFADHALSASATAEVGSRAVFSSGPYGVGPFRWREHWQIGRMPDGAPTPDALIALFPVLLQFRYAWTGLGWLDHVRQQSAFRRAFLPLVPLMRQASVTLLDPSRRRSSHSWMFREVDGSLGCEWLQHGYVLPSTLTNTFHAFENPDVAIWGPDEPASGDLPRFILEPHLRAFEQLSPEAQEQYLLGCHWYHKALNANDVTDAFLDMIVMVESFLPDESAPCEKCSQPVFSVSKRFKEFLSKHAGPRMDAPQQERSEFQRIAGRLYGLRSAVAHAGSSLVAEHLGASIGFVPNDVEERWLLDALRVAGSRALLSWMGEAATIAV